MPITFSCPDCGQSISASTKYSGRSAKCPKCGCRLVVPKPPRAAKMSTATLDPATVSPPPPTQTPTTPQQTQNGSSILSGLGMDGMSAGILSQVLGSSLDTAAKIRDLAITSLGQNTLRKNVLIAHGAQTTALDGPYRANLLGLSDIQKAQIAPFPEVRGININTTVPIVAGGQDPSAQPSTTLTNGSPAPTLTPAPTNGSTPAPGPTNGGTPTPAPALTNGGTPPAAASKTGWLLPAVLGAALAGGGLAGGIGINKYYNQPTTTSNPPPATQPANPGPDAGVGLKVE